MPKRRAMFLAVKFAAASLSHFEVACRDTKIPRSVQHMARPKSEISHMEQVTGLPRLQFEEGLVTD